MVDNGPPADTRSGQVCHSSQDTSGPWGHADDMEKVGWRSPPSASPVLAAAVLGWKAGSKGHSHSF